MKRLRRWVFNFATALSLIACATSLVFLFRSEFIGLDVYSVIPFPRERSQNIFMFFSWRGSVSLMAIHRLSPTTSDADTKWFTIQFCSNGTQGEQFTMVRPYNWHFGFVYERGGLDAPTQPTGAISQFATMRLIGVPWWIITVAAMILPGLRARRTLRSRRRRPWGLCSACGYDLRATPERCPECGIIPAAAKGAAT